MYVGIFVLAISDTWANLAIGDSSLLVMAITEASFFLIFSAISNDSRVYRLKLITTRASSFFTPRTCSGISPIPGVSSMTFFKKKPEIES